MSAARDKAAPHAGGPAAFSGPAGRAAAFKHRDIRLLAAVPAKPARVYRALVNAGELRRWWALEAETEPRNLGPVRLAWPGLELRGLFVDLEPGRKVAWLWSLEGIPKAVPRLASVFIEPSGDRAEVAVVHAGFPAARRADGQFERWTRFWRDCLARLAARFSR